MTTHTVDSKIKIKNYWYVWTYLGNYSEPTLSPGLSPEGVRDMILACFGRSFTTKGKIYVWDKAPVLTYKGDNNDDHTHS